MKIIQLLSTATLLLALSSCKNPADKTTAAGVEEAQVALSGSGAKFSFTDKSSIEFTGSKITGSQSGGFKKFAGHFTLNEGATLPTSGVIIIEMDSLYSDSEKLTGHLKNADFFDVEKFPTSTFTMTEVKETASQSYELSGNFNLHGITKNITFPATTIKEGDTLKLKAEFDINRKDFGIIYAGKTDDLIRDEVVIRLNMEAKQQ